MNQSASFGSNRGLLKQSQSLTSKLTQVLLVSYKLLQINNFLVKEHASNLAGMIAHHGLDAGVDRVANNLLPVVEVS